MKTGKSVNTSNKKEKDNVTGESYLEYQKLNEHEKKQLQVKDGQNNHHVDERGGF
ncbi:hypothetical protein SAMN05421670_2118 [Psychrobacillus psychrotolerans]|uniref:Uncharacterized protein n=1 Tax=Psychrobacillus psychrotolerans TaxID=126156 RepID=A0A1I5YN09_9BACI|nr:hypothetical protein [Psychrobacillus psychrotolerans]SFQ45510.1 hypothetical protein SAMN05421670_2118 [Psychrobacillus psychrotolerans]